MYATIPIICRKDYNLEILCYRGYTIKVMKYFFETGELTRERNLFLEQKTWNIK